MFDPGKLLGLLTQALIEVPQLKLPIKAYDENYPYRNDISLAISQMVTPSLLVAWRGTVPAAKGRLEVWSHLYSVILRADDQAGSDYSYFKLWTAISNGKSSRTGSSIRTCALDPLLYPMDTPSIMRQTLYPTENSRVDYHEVTISISEKGDS
jgi:hypothetical protein